MIRFNRMLGGLFVAAALLMSLGAGAQQHGGWEKPVAGVVETHGRLAAGKWVHVVGHRGGKLVHRASKDHGITWEKETVIAEGTRDFPMMYGGIFVKAGGGAKEDTVYLLCSEGYMGGDARVLNFRRSNDGGATWSAPVRVTDEGHEMIRARIVASGDFVHVGGAAAPKPSGKMLYVRSVDGGKTWEKVRELAKDLGEYGGGQTVAVDGNTVHLAYTKVRNGLGGGDTFYIRSLDNGATWSDPVDIGEKGPDSDRQARAQIVAAGGHVLVTWQREGKFTGAPVPAMRLGYNTSGDGGKTWDGAKILPGEGTDRNHQQICMTADGAACVCWREGAVTETDSMGCMSSKNFGRDWDTTPSGFATGKANHPYSIACDGVAVHVLCGPLEEMVYARKLLAK